jgi:hypothetical protein
VKPFPRRDFPVQVVEEYWERDADDPTREHYQGIYHVQLNFTARIVFAPAFDRPHRWGLVNWDDHVAGELAEITSSQRARLAEALCCSYVVTPDTERAGSDDQIQVRGTVAFAGDRRLEVSPVVLFHVTDKDFGSYAVELPQLAGEIAERGTSYPRAPALPVSHLGQYRVIRLLLERVIPSGLLESYHHPELLGRT